MYAVRTTHTQCMCANEYVVQLFDFCLVNICIEIGLCLLFIYFIYFISLLVDTLKQQ